MSVKPHQQKAAAFDFRVAWARAKSSKRVRVLAVPRTLNREVPRYFLQVPASRPPAKHGDRYQRKGLTGTLRDSGSPSANGSGRRAAGDGHGCMPRIDQPGAQGTYSDLYSVIVLMYACLVPCRARRWPAPSPAWRHCVGALSIGCHLVSVRSAGGGI